MRLRRQFWIPVSRLGIWRSQAELRPPVSSHVARLITIHRPESRRLILAPIGPVPFLCCSFLRCVPFLCCFRLPLAGLRKHAIEVSQRDTFAHLGVFSDLIDHARSGVLRETGQSCGDHLLRIRDLLAVENVIPVPRDLRVESTWTKRGLRCGEFRGRWGMARARSDG